MDIVLKNDRYIVHFNPDTGTITKSQIDTYTIEQEIYLVIFEDYTKSNPVYRELRIKEIVIDNQRDDFLECTVHFYDLIIETGTVVDSLSSKLIIHMQSDCISIKIVLNENKENRLYRFGIVVPYDAGLLENTLLADEELTITPVVNFHRTWDRKWPTETYISFPSVSHKIDNGYISWLCPVNYNSQFFFHNNRLRLTTTTLVSNEFEVILAKHTDSVKDAYTRLFPSSNLFVNFWKVQINKILYRYNIHVTYNSSSGVDNQKIRFSSLSIENIGPAINTLTAVIERYGRRLSDLGLKEIILCENLWRDREMNGFLLKNSNMFLSYVSDSNLAKMLHHEVFHLLQSTLTDLSEVSSGWSNHSDVPVQFNAEDFSEGSAILYSHMLTDPLMIEHFSNLHPHLQHRIKIVESIYESAYGEKLKWLYNAGSGVRTHHDLDVSHIDPQSISIKGYLRPSLTGSSPEVKSTTNMFMLCGMCGSGVNLVARHWRELKDSKMIVSHNLNDMLTAGIFIYTHYIDHLDDFLNIYNKLDCKVIAIIRHPSYYAKPNDRMDIWWNIYSYIEQLDGVTLIRYEDLVLNYISTIKHISGLLGLPVNEVNNIIDYDRVTPRDDSTCGSFYRKHASDIFLSRILYI